MHGAEIAIIGMSGRFPDAENPQIFWKNLIKGHESIKFLTDDEVASIDDTELISHPKYIRSKGGVLDGLEYFDGSFFGYTPKEVEIMDPQFRIFHECAWEALEDAGYANGDENNIGVFAGASGNSLWHHKLLISNKYKNHSGLVGSQLIERDFLSTLISYNLNLKGPSYNIQTACSTSLVAVHTACQSILNGECNVAMAGGVSISQNTDKGYIYQEGSILSPDGHCRAFDANAKGSIYGSGAGVVVLKLLEEAIADKDHIYAVIKGSAINNDGKRKVGFTAPSVLGQKEVIKAAHVMAEVNARDIGYVETHGTGTELGDPIEVEALNLAFDSLERNYCAIGSLKTNIGHLDAAAGVAGLIKTSLALKHKIIPPSLNFENPNPKINFDKSPFYVASTKSEWASNKTRYAGVSSFGIGGTNAHVVLQEAPIIESKPSNKAFHFLPFAAKSKKSCEKWLERFSNHLKDSTDKIEDIANTLITGRKNFGTRGFIVVPNKEEAIKQINDRNVLINEESNFSLGSYSTVFMFPGQGSQYFKMGYDIFMHEPFFRSELQKCFEIYNSITGSKLNLEELLYSKSEHDEIELLNETYITQPLLFIFEYALAKFIMHIGVTPDIMIGHSLGEYVAACLAGVFTLKDALKIVVCRGNLIQSLDKGSMLSVATNENTIKNYLRDNICIAAVNSPTQCVVSGPTDEILTLQKDLTEAQIPATLLKTSHAFHSMMMEPAMNEFKFNFDELSLSAPKIPFISNVTGELITVSEATSPTYWASHIRETVRFADGVAQIMKHENIAFLEVGPGNTLTNLILRHQDHKGSHKSIVLVRHSRQNSPDDSFLYEGLGKLWLMGMKVKFEMLYELEERSKVSLPTYYFEKHRVNEISENIINPQTVKTQEKEALKNWFYSQIWQRKMPESSTFNKVVLEKPKRWIIFASEDNLSISLSEYLNDNSLTIVKIGIDYLKQDNTHFIINPLEVTHYSQLVKDLLIGENDDIHIIHAWALGDFIKNEISLDRCKHIMNESFYSIINSVRAIGYKSKSINLTLLTRNIFEVIGNDCLYPEMATNVSLAKILPLEYNHIACQLIDISKEHLLISNSNKISETIFEIISKNKSETIIALRGNHRWLPKIEPIEIDESLNDSTVLCKNNVYVIMGLGGMGVYMAKYLTEELNSTVFIIHRSEFPPQDQWNDIVTKKENSQLYTKVSILENIRLKGNGAVHLIHCDITNLDQMQKEIDNIEYEFGKIHGVIQAAGIVDKDGIMQRRTNESIHENIKAKVEGTIIIETIFRDRGLEFFVLFSSIGNEIFEEKYGQIAYNTGNEFIDAYASYESKIRRKIVINWCDWQEVGMSIKSIEELFTTSDSRQREFDIFNRFSIKPQEGIEVFKRVCNSKLTRAVIYPTNLIERLEQRDITLQNYSKYLECKFKLLTHETSNVSNVIPEFGTLDDNVVHIWKDYLGYKEISIHDNIFELGASSLDVVQINNIFKSSLNIDVPVTTLFEHPTISSFLGYIKAGDKKNEIVEPSERIDKGLSKLGRLKKISSSNE